MSQTLTITSQSLIKPSTPPSNLRSETPEQKMQDDLEAIANLILLIAQEENDPNFPLSTILGQIQDMIGDANDMKQYDPSWGTLQNSISDLITDLTSASDMLKSGNTSGGNDELWKIFSLDIPLLLALISGH